jgi:glycyl-tRNA synthetase beta chain
MMRWNDEGIRFVRPIRWILALYGEQVIPFRYAGVAREDTVMAVGRWAKNRL